MKNNYSLFIIGLLLFTLSCSKEKRTERTLYTKGGDWNIKSLNWQQVSVSSSTGESIAIGTTNDAGSFTFDKNGTGTYNFNVNGTNYAQSFTWNVSDENIALTKINQTVDFMGGEIEQLVVSMSGTRSDKKNMVLAGTETRIFTSGDVTETVLTGTFTLEKK